jgi:hypothetical protein
MRYLISIVAACFVFSSACFAAPGISVAGTDRIPIGDYYDAPVVVAGWQQPYKITLAGGKLPYGLRLTADGRIAGYPEAVERTTAKIRAAAPNGDSAEQEVAFLVPGEGFRLLYRDLPVAPLGKTTSVKIEGIGGAPPYKCNIERVRTFFAGAAKPGAKAPTIDEAPAWLTLGGDCTLTATPDKETIVIFIVSAKDSAGAAAKEFYALRSASDPGSMGWIEKKARDYNIDYQNRFSPYGLTLEIDQNGAYQSYGDSAIWTGTYLAGAAYYYAVTGEDFARANLVKSLDATTRLREITGVPGLIARAYENDEWVGKAPTPRIEPDPAEHRYLVENGPYKGWRFLSTASRDQFTGVFWGNATVYELFDDPALKAPASTNIVSMASHVWDNNMHIMDADGKRTRHGVMSGYGIQDSEGEMTYDPYESPARVSNGFNVTLILNWFDMAASTAPDEATRRLWRERYLALISNKPNPAPDRSFERGYLTHLKKLYVYGEAFNTYWETAWFNMNLLFNNYFHLIRFEHNPKIRSIYRETLKYLWDDKKPMADGCEAPQKRRAGREHNPHFTWQYLAAEGDRDPDKIFDAVNEMILFPTGPRQPFNIVDPVDFPSVPGHDDWACEAIPIQYRIPSDFQWQRSPYSLSKTWPTDEMGRNFAGVDMITPYWMGRYFGYVPGNI